MTTQVMWSTLKEESGALSLAGRQLVVREPAPEWRKRPLLLDRVRLAIRAKHYSRSTEDAYVSWIRRFILFHNKRHPKEMGEKEITQFLTSLAVERKVSASTQNQALNALLFLYREILRQDFPWLDNVVRAKNPCRLPVVLSREEVLAVLDQLQGTPLLVAKLLYGAGLRLMECLRLRVKDVQLPRNQIVVRRGKGDKDRVTLLPVAVRTDLRQHL